MAQNYHELYLSRHNRSQSSRFDYFVAFTPLGVAEFRTLSTNEYVQSLPDEKLDRLWLKPIQRMLQQRFIIEQRAFSDGTIPTLDALTEDFKVATALTIDKFAKNEDEKTGQESVSGVGTVKWDNEVPSRAKSLLERYSWKGGRVGRS
jgi:hypothetical protein